jgi:hypothetical protein
MLKYIILHSQHEADLEIAVSKKMSEGYKLYGNLIIKDRIDNKVGFSVFYQVMIYSPPPDYTGPR